MFIEEMPPKIYKWQKRNKNNKHNLIYERCRRGGGPYFFMQGRGAEFEVTPLYRVEFRRYQPK